MAAKTTENCTRRNVERLGTAVDKTRSPWKLYVTQTDTTVTIDWPRGLLNSASKLKKRERERRVLVKDILMLTIMSAI